MTSEFPGRTDPRLGRLRDSARRGPACRPRPTRPGPYRHRDRGQGHRGARSTPARHVWTAERGEPDPRLRGPHERLSAGSLGWGWAGPRPGCTPRPRPRACFWAASREIGTRRPAPSARARKGHRHLPSRPAGRGGTLQATGKQGCPGGGSALSQSRALFQASRSEKTARSQCAYLRRAVARKVKASENCSTRDEMGLRQQRDLVPKKCHMSHP